MIKLIASDMDGTFLNTKHKISEENLKAVKKAEAMGVEFTIVTGRAFPSIDNYAREAKLNCEFVLMNGAEYRDKDGNVIESISIDKNNLKEIHKIMSRNGLLLDIFSNKGRLILDKKIFDEQILEKAKWFNKNDSIEDAQKFIDEMMKRDNVQFLESIDEVIENDEIEVYKIITFNLDLELIVETKKELSKIEGLSVVSTFSNDIEISHLEAQKGKILSKVIEKKGYSKEEVIVIGDSFNDYSMFEEFENSYAMGNAVDEIKKIARYVTDTNDNNGVAKAIYQALSIN